MLAIAVIVAMSSPVIVTVSSKGPVRSISDALIQVKKLSTQGYAPSSVRIVVQPGIYPVRNRPISLDATASGLTISGRKGARLVGGRFLHSWKISSDPRVSPTSRGKIYECDLGDLNPGVLNRRGFGLPRQNAALELFLDGQPMRLASYPNDSWLRIAATPQVDTLTTDSDRPASWSKDNEIWALGYWQFDWAESYEPVMSIAGRMVTFVKKPGVYDALVGRRIKFLNILEELDQPGEYVVDRKLRKAFLWPTKPIAKAEILASELEPPMFSIQDAHNVTIEGLQIEGGRGGAIYAAKCEAIKVSKCLVRNFGTYGVSIENCEDSMVSGCDLTGLGEFGISLNGGDRKTLTPGNLVAEDNHIWGYSRWCRTYQPAVLIDGVGNRISHSWIHDAPHQAVLLTGNDHVIEYNKIERVCTETGDAGAIYMGRNPTMRGTVIRYNLLRDLGPKVSTEGNYVGVMGVYLDDCWCGTTIKGNVFDMNGTGIMIGGGRDNTVENNVFLGCQPAIHFDARGIGWAKDFFKKSTEWGMVDRFNEVNADKPPYTTRYPQLATYLTDAPDFPKGNRIVRNLACGGKWTTLLDGLTEKDYLNEANIIEPAPLTLALALQKKPAGFLPIPVKAIGLLRQRK